MSMILLNQVVRIQSYNMIAQPLFPYTIQGGEKLKIKLNVFNLNTWGSSYFEDLPIPSNEEPYDVESIRHTLIEVIE